MSKQLKASEKKSEADRQAFPLDKYIFRAATYGLAGFGVGLATSLFFKHKAPITAFFTGTGAGYGMHGLTDDYQSYQKQKSWVDTRTKQRFGGGDDDDENERDSDFKKYSQAQRDQEWARLQKDEFKSSQQRNEQKKDDNLRQKRDQQEQDKDSGSKFERQGQKFNQEKADNQRQQKRDQDQDRDSSFKFERQGQKSNQEKPDIQRQKRDQQEQDKDSGSKFERQGQKFNQEKADIQKRDQKEQGKDSGSKFERQGQKSNQEKADIQKRDQKEQGKDSGSKFERQGQQGKQEGKSNEQQYQQSKQQSQQARRQAQKDTEEPLNPEAQYKKDMADRWNDFIKPLEKPDAKMGQGHDFAMTTQDKGKREEEALYSQSMQGYKANTDEITKGERGPQNPKIPPSQRDWTGGHANKGVLPSQVHRGTPEADKMGKSPRPDTEPNKNPDQGVPKQRNQALSNVDLKGQSLQTFESNPLPMGKAGPTHEIQKNYQQGRDRATDPNLDNTRRRIAGLEQDRMGKSVKEGTLFTDSERSDTTAGVHNYRPVAEQNLKNQVNAVLE